MESWEQFMFRFVAMGVVLLFSGCSGGSSTPSNGSNTEISKPKAPSQSEVYNGPFGLRMGQPLSELKVDEDSDPAKAKILTSVPKPMSDFEIYAVVGFPKIGICEIRAVSKTFESDAYGHSVTSEMDKLAAALATKYGKYKKIDSCTDSNCEFFNQNLESGSQVYTYEWSRSTGAKIPDDISEIYMAAQPSEFNNTHFRLDYVSSNRKACEDAQNNAKAAAL